MAFEFYLPWVYGAPINFALSFMTLIWNLILLSRIHYTSASISKLTLWPYWISFGYLCSKQVQDILFLF